MPLVVHTSLSKSVNVQFEALKPGMSSYDTAMYHSAKFHTDLITTAHSVNLHPLS